MALNQSLYDALTIAVKRGILRGKLPIMIKSEGQTNQVEYYVDATETDPHRKNRQKVRMCGNGEGETYWVCCPSCKDHRPRLCVNYAWGTIDLKTNGKLYRFIHCFNEECQSRVEGFSRLFESELARAGFLGGGVDLSTAAAPRDREKVDLLVPGPCVRLDELPPTHPANKFLTTKGHDYRKLANNFGVSYCISSRMPFADNRIIFPIVEGNTVRGWQARYVDDAGGGESWKGLWFCKSCRTYSRLPDPKGHLDRCVSCQGDEVERVPKYWTMPRFRKSEHVGGLDAAKAWPFVVITEGPTDPMHLGTPEESDVQGPGIFLFGHSLSTWQRKLVYENFYTKAVILLLDPDAYKDQGNIYQEMKGNFYGGVAAVLLPDGRGPDTCPHDLLWEFIFATAHKEGLILGADPNYLSRLVGKTKPMLPPVEVNLP